MCRGLHRGVAIWLNLIWAGERSPEAMLSSLPANDRQLNLQFHTRGCKLCRDGFENNCFEWQVTCFEPHGIFNLQSSNVHILWMIHMHWRTNYSNLITHVFSGWVEQTVSPSRNRGPELRIPLVYHVSSSEKGVFTGFQTHTHRWVIKNTTTVYYSLQQGNQQQGHLLTKCIMILIVGYYFHYWWLMVWLVAHVFFNHSWFSDPWIILVCSVISFMFSFLRTDCFFL